MEPKKTEQNRNRFIAIESRLMTARWEGAWGTG